MAKGLTATVDRFEDGRAVLRLDDGQEFTIDRAWLSPSVHEGSVLTISFVADSEAEADKANTARQLLSDILRGT